MITLFIPACAEAYPKKEEQDSCNLGCKSQKPYTVDQQEVILLNFFKTCQENISVTM